MGDFIAGALGILLVGAVVIGLGILLFGTGAFLVSIGVPAWIVWGWGIVFVLGAVTTIFN